MQGLKLDKYVLFRNKKVKKSQPDFVGTINIDGTIYGMVAWIKIDQNDDQFISGTINQEISPEELDTATPELQKGKDLDFCTTCGNKIKI